METDMAHSSAVAAD